MAQRYGQRSLDQSPDELAVRAQVRFGEDSGRMTPSNANGDVALS